MIDVGPVELGSNIVTCRVGAVRGSLDVVRGSLAVVRGSLDVGRGSLIVVCRPVNAGRSFKFSHVVEF